MKISISKISDDDIMLKDVQAQNTCDACSTYEGYSSAQPDGCTLEDTGWVFGSSF